MKKIILALLIAASFAACSKADTFTTPLNQGKEAYILNVTGASITYSVNDSMRSRDMHISWTTNAATSHHAVDHYVYYFDTLYSYENWYTDDVNYMKCQNFSTGMHKMFIRAISIDGSESGIFVYDFEAVNN